MDKSKINFISLKLTDGSSHFVPDDIKLKLPQDSHTASKFAHFLLYIPWEDDLLERVPPAYRDFYQYVLPDLHFRTTDVHVAICMPFVEELIRLTKQEVDRRVVYIAFILHDVGWSRLSDKEIASSLGIKGLALNKEALGPKEKHAFMGKQMAEDILTSYVFDPTLSESQKGMILNAVLYHDKPWVLAVGGNIPLEIKLVCDVDHLWSFTHQNFWQDTVRKGVDPKEYLSNLERDLDGYFITQEAKDLATKMLRKRSAEVAQLLFIH